MGDALSCRVANYSSTSTVCACDLCSATGRRRLDSTAAFSLQSAVGADISYGVIQVVGMVESSAVEFSQVISTISTFNWANSLRSAMIVYIALGILFALLPAAIVLHQLFHTGSKFLRRGQVIQPIPASLANASLGQTMGVIGQRACNVSQQFSCIGRL